MNVFPAIDLMSGQAVRLDQGRFEDKTTYSTEPIELAKRYAAQGARYLHVVDLDGARAQQPVHTDLIAAMVAAVADTGVHVQVGGGIRTPDHVAALLASGADRVVIGSLAVRNQALTEEIIAAVGPERITLAVDVRPDERGVPRVATAGWQRGEDVTACQLIERYLPRGLSRALCTDIARDGQMTGPNVELYRDLAERFADVEILASGGVGSLDDVRAISRSGISGVIIGKALLEGTFTVKEALQC